MKILRLKPGGVEYVHIPVAGAPFDAGQMEVSFDNDATWNAATWNNDMTEISLLVGGPDGTSIESFVELPRGSHEFAVRLVDTPETVIRQNDTVIEVR